MPSAFLWPLLISSALRATTQVNSRSKADMRSRNELLLEIIEHATPKPRTLEDLRTYGWDSRDELVTLTKSHVLRILAAFKAGTLNAPQVRDWANRLEGRDDIGYADGSDGVVNEAIFWLANPAINWPIDEAICVRIEVLFSSS